MIITRTPFRISFFGGGTDYPVWYRERPGAVLATTINKYCHISCRFLPPFFDYTSRIVWSKIEHVNDPSQIQHPAVRAALQFLRISRGISLHHEGDLPARSGMGSSSAFTVGLLHALSGLQGALSSKERLARDAMHVEQRLLRENVGSQDQVLTAYGGFNRISFSGEDCLRVEPVLLPQQRLLELRRHLLLCFTGLSRTASEIAAEQIKKTSDKTAELQSMYGMVDEALRILSGRDDLLAFGRLLHESWVLKRGLTEHISTPYLDELYDAACRAGAIGGKLLGAGGGGFFLLFARPEHHQKIKERLRKVLHIPFEFEHGGSQVIFYEPENPAEGLQELSSNAAASEGRIDAAVPGQPASPERSLAGVSS